MGSPGLLPETVQVESGQAESQALVSDPKTLLWIITVLSACNFFKGHESLVGILGGWAWPLLPCDPTLPASHWNSGWPVEGTHKCLLIKCRKEGMLFDVPGMFPPVSSCLVVKRGYVWNQISAPPYVRETLGKLLDLSVSQFSNL